MNDALATETAATENVIEMAGNVEKMPIAVVNKTSWKAETLNKAKRHQFFASIISSTFSLSISYASIRDNPIL